MFFKPKIFISSTFDLSQLRDCLKTFFETIGAEALLYEHNLTPSYSKKVYLQDVANADFVIFIFHNRYGTKTEGGRSGIHEEWDAIKEVKVPFHIYVYESEKQEDEMKDFLTKEVHIDQYSYYYFKSDDDLLKRIKETTFQIASEIENYRINNKDLPEDIINQLVFKHDYKLAIEIIKPFNYCLEKYDLSYFIHFDFILQVLSPWCYVFDDTNAIFIDRQFNDKIKPLLDVVFQFNRLQSQYVTRYKKPYMTLKIDDNSIIITKFDCFYHKEEWLEVEAKLKDLLSQIINTFQEFNDYVFQVKKKFELRVSWSVPELL